MRAHSAPSCILRTGCLCSGKVVQDSTIGSLGFGWMGQDGSGVPPGLMLLIYMTGPEDKPPTPFGATRPSARRGLRSTTFNKSRMTFLATLPSLFLLSHAVRWISSRFPSSFVRGCLPAKSKYAASPSRRRPSGRLMGKLGGQVTTVLT